MADINKEASWVTARLMEISNATQDGTNILITNANLGNFVPSDVVRTSAQTLTDTEQQQARTNIGAASTSALNSAIVELDSELIALENGKVDKPEESTEGNVAIFGSNSNISDSGISKDNLLIAPQLASNNIKTDNIPYVYRQTGGGIGTGNREYDSIEGGSIVWNQIQKGRNASSGTSILLTYTTDGKLTVVVNNPTASASIVLEWPTLTKNHKYLMYVPNASKANGFEYYVSNFSHRGSLDNWVMNYTGDTGATATRFYVSTSAANGTYEFYPMCIDLTVLFGATVADYLYTQDNSTVGYACAYLKRMGLLTGAYYPYNAGELMSVSGLQSHKTVGFNAWDEEWELGYYNTSGQPTASANNIRSKNYIKVLGGTRYYVKSNGQYCYVCQYDDNYNFIGSRTGYIDTTFSTESNARYIRINMASGYGVVYKHDICINISDAVRNGAYEPYTEYTYPLDSSLTLRGVAVIDENNNIKFDGDEYAPDGTVTRRYHEYTFNGSEGWAIAATGTNRAFRYNVAFNPAVVSAAQGNNAFTGNWASPTTVIDNVQNGGFTEWVFRTTVNASNSNLLVVTPTSDVDMTVDQFKAKLASTPLKIIARMATPTTEQAEPYESLQICDPLGTEEYVTTGIVPVGHETRYPEDQIAKLDGLPSDFSTLIAPTEKAFTATRAYEVGDSLIVDNTLYEVISAISSGSTITPGTNVEAVPVSDIIKNMATWESVTVTRNSSYLSTGATYCLVNRRMKIAVLFGWFNIATVPSSGATLLTLSGIKPYNNYVYTYAHKGESIISLRSNTSSGNLTLSTDSGTSANVVTGAYALQTVIIPIL